jgi:MFS family permease
MTTRTARRPGKLSILMIVTSIGASVAISVALNLVGLRLPAYGPEQIIVAAALFNATCILQSVVGAIIEWRRPGHTIGRLLLLSGPAYGFASAGWTTLGALESVVDPQIYRFASWAVFMLSYPAVALIAGWIPLVFPTGTLPGPRWRVPIAVLIVLSAIGLAAMAVRPGRPAPETELVNPFGIEGWPDVLQPFVDALPLGLVVLVGLGAAAVVTRYRRGDRVERLQIRWLVSAVAITAIGLAGLAVSYALGSDSPPIATWIALVPFVGIMLVPVAIGIAVLRYRLFEIDRIISRTLSWALVTGLLGAVFVGLVVGLQALSADITGTNTLAVAASTLVVAALFQPLRRRIQSAVDRRFNRARYDAERTAAAFAGQLRNEVDLGKRRAALVDTVEEAVRPASATVWLRAGSGR